MEHHYIETYREIYNNAKTYWQTAWFFKTGFFSFFFWTDLLITGRTGFLTVNWQTAVFSVCCFWTICHSNLFICSQICEDYCICNRRNWNSQTLFSRKDCVLIQMKSLNESLALNLKASIIHLNIEQNICLCYDKKQAQTGIEISYVNDHEWSINALERSFTGSETQHTQQHCILPYSVNDVHRMLL